MPMNFIFDGDLGGCVATSEEYPNGDPLTWSPGIWNWVIKDGPLKILDVGCGVGHSAKFFKDHGCEVIALEGSQKVIDQAITDNIIQYDFRHGGFNHDIQVDVAWCCEVAEHIDPEYVDGFLDTLAAANTVLMTHATPGQAGHHHVDCQPASYWIAGMRRHGMKLDVVQTQFLRSIALIEGGPNHHFAQNGLVFVSGTPTQNTAKSVDAVFTWASGKEFCRLPEFEVFRESLRRIGFKGKKLIFTHDMDVDVRVTLDSEGFEVIDVDPGRVECVVRDRFLHYHEELQKGHYRNVLFVDSKDVLFQRDPFCLIPQYIPNTYPQWCILFSEGCKHNQIEWNMRDQGNLQTRLGKFRRNFEEWDVINGGVQFGTAEAMKDLAFNIWHTTLFVHGAGSDRPICSEQAVLNYMFHVGQNPDRTNYLLFTPNHFCAVAHGEAMIQGVFEAGHYMSRDKLRHHEFNESFLMFHQWDRTPYRDAILKEYRVNS